MRLFSLMAVVIIGLAGTAQADIKFYDSTATNGTPGDSLLSATNLCPPLQTTVDDLQGFTEIDDGAAGTVTLNAFTHTANNLIDLGPEQLTITFGPGAFIFIDNFSTRTITASQPSNTSGIGAHGPSSTAPGATTEWGVISSWAITGGRYCVSSPVGICNENGFSHGATIPAIVESQTYDLGTWNFDAEGDYEMAQFYIFRTSNGGLSNNQQLWRGAFHGSALPALPMIGFGALAVALAVVGGRSLMGRK